MLQPSTNGLFSRFLFYHLELDPTCKDTFRNTNNGELLDYLHHLEQDFWQFYELLCKQPPIPVNLTEFRMDRFYYYFSNIQSRYLTLKEDGFVATVRRMGPVGMGNESSDNVAVNKTGAKLVSLGEKNRLWLAGGCMDNSWNRGVGLGLDFINGNFYGKLLSLLIEKHFLCLP